jgi:tape measure domain-containing protein
LIAEGNKAEKEMTDLGHASANAGQQMGGMSNAISGLGGMLASAGLAIGAAEILNLGKSAIQSAINYETLSVQFEVFLGSAEKATEVLAALNKFSIETPFTPDQVNASGRALLAFGFTTEQLIPTLKMVGDVSAAVGKDFNELAVIYGKARTAGTLYAEDINQLTEAGIPIMDELAKVLGVQADQVKKLGSEGKISFATLETAFGNMTGEGGRFNGMMDKMSQSTAGLLSTIEGKLQDLYQLLVFRFQDFLNSCTQQEFFLDRL